MAEAATCGGVVRAVESAGGGLVAVIGASDTGKTALCAHLLGLLSREGTRCGFVDADVGQSTVGPPGSISLSFIDGAFLSFSRLSAAALSFVGDVSPSGHVGTMVSGVSRLVNTAKRQRVHVCVLDTTGLFHGREGRALKNRVLAAISPDYLVVTASGSEAARSLSGLATGDAAVFCPGVSPCVRSRNPAERAVYRYRRFKRYFRSSSRHRVSPSSAVLARCRQAQHEDRLHGLLVGLLRRDGVALALGVALEMLGPDLVLVAPEFPRDELERIELGSFALDPEQVRGLGS